MTGIYLSIRSLTFVVSDNVFEVSKGKSKDYLTILIREKAELSNIIQKLHSNFNFNSDHLKQMFNIRCFDAVFWRPYRCFSISLKRFYPCPIATKFSPVIDCIEVCLNTAFIKIEINMTTINKKLRNR